FGLYRFEQIRAARPEQMPRAESKAKQQHAFGALGTCPIQITDRAQRQRWACRAQSLYCAKRPPLRFGACDASARHGIAERRNKAIAPYARDLTHAANITKIRRRFRTV